MVHSSTLQLKRKSRRGKKITVKERQNISSVLLYVPFYMILTSVQFMRNNSSRAERQELFNFRRWCVFPQACLLLLGISRMMLVSTSTSFKEETISTGTTLQIFVLSSSKSDIFYVWPERDFAGQSSSLTNTTSSCF